jgi:peptidyl-dipeptidase Dcp
LAAEFTSRLAQLADCHGPTTMIDLPTRRPAGFAAGFAALIALCCALWPASARPADGFGGLLQPWTGPHGGLPPLGHIDVADFEPALEAGMALQRRNIAYLAANPAPPTFANTVLALERSGAALDRVTSLYDLWRGSLNTAPFQEVQNKMQPRLAAHRDGITQNAALFRRIDAVYRSPEMARLTPEQRRLVWSYHTDFVKQGARLDAAAKQRVAEINQALASLQNAFSQHLRDDEASKALVITDAADLAGLSGADIDAAAAEAARRSRPGAWVFANTRSAIEPFLTRSSRREWREQAWQLWTRRGDEGDANDNNGLVTRILALRDERTRLLGFPSYAHWKLSDSMAANPQAALDLMLKVWQPAAQAFRRDVAEMQKLVDAEGGGFTVQPWDTRYYAEKLRRSSHDLDLGELTPYLQLDRLREAMFMAAGRLYGLRFTRLSDVPVFHPDASVYDVRRTDGQLVGLWYFDPYAREGKNSGAWMGALRLQNRLDGAATTAIVTNSSNFIRSQPGQPVLLSWDDAVTLFHEFGHALHGLLSDVTYSSLASPNTLDDFGEFPSQLNEHWLGTPAVLAMLVDTAGRPLPQALLDKVRRASTFNKGFEQAEYLASGIVDMKLHMRGDALADPKAFEEATLAEIGMPPQLVARHRVPQFAHVFAGEGYAAGYYNYLWAAVLEHDAWHAFVEAGDPFDPRLAKRLRDTILAVGNTVDPAQAFRDFRGRGPQVGALLSDYGFASSDSGRR